MFVSTLFSGGNNDVNIVLQGSNDINGWTTLMTINLDRLEVGEDSWIEGLLLAKNLNPWL